MRNRCESVDNRRTKPFALSVARLASEVEASAWHFDFGLRWAGCPSAREAMDGQERPAYAQGERIWGLAIGMGSAKCNVQSHDRNRSLMKIKTSARISTKDVHGTREFGLSLRAGCF